MPHPHLTRDEAISIHALREEGDHTTILLASTKSYFYPRPPRGGRPLATQLASCCCEFLSTPSARRATSPRRSGRQGGANFYPRPPRGGRHLCRHHQQQGRMISIHALREEGDPFTKHYFRQQMQFLSTPSARRATTANDGKESTSLFLSTPSARRATIKTALEVRRYCDFYPRPPRGGRRTWFLPVSTPKVFLSTPSARRATTLG